MTQEDREAEHQWVLKMLALEEEQGPFLPSGAGGGVGARARRKRSAARRARENVRFVASAVSAPENQAA
jgi:hypothetical protein